VQPDIAVTFDLRPYTIVKSVAQRGLLKWWSDPARKRLPSRADCQAEALQPLWPDMALYEVRHENGGLRYKCLSHGARLRPVDGADLTGRYLDEFFPEPIKQAALAAYDATVAMACPIYTVRNAIDADQVPVTFERIRLPLGDGERIDHLLTHVEIFCEDGRYEREDLLRAGLSIRDYAVTAAISMAAIGLSPGAEVVDS
jgi:PAS domain